MTVIAWDGKTLAADRRACLGNTHRTIHKLHRMTDCLCASAGESDAAQELIAWFEAGRDPAAFPPSQRDMIFMTRVVLGYYEYFSRAKSRLNFHQMVKRWAHQGWRGRTIAIPPYTG